MSSAEDSEDPMDGLVTPAEAATLVPFAKSTLDKWRSANKGPPWCKVGSKVYYPVHGLRKWVADEIRRSGSFR